MLSQLNHFNAPTSQKNTSFHSYDEVVQYYVKSLPSVHLPAPYSYHEKDLETRYAYSSGHSTNSERPNIVCILPSNFPLYSSLHSTTTAQKSQKMPRTSFHSSNKNIDHASHVMECLQWTAAEAPSERKEDALNHVWLFGEWTEAGPSLSMLLGSEFRVRSFTTMDMDKPVMQELDWILFLTSLRSQTPVKDRIYLFFDWPHSASNASERHQFMMLQLAVLFLVKPDYAMIRIQLASELNRDLKYPKGKLVIPMSDDPIVEQLLLWTSNEEYTSEFERYPASKLRDQFMYFIRETFEQVKYQDSMNGAVISYLVKRQQMIQAHRTLLLAEMHLSGQEGDMSLPIPMIFLRDIEFATNEGYVAIVEKRQGSSEDDGMQSDCDYDRVYLYSLH